MVEISVIVPVLNEEKALPKLFSCLDNQTHKNSEVILVNDGSADRSDIILHGYVSSKPKCQVITLKENVGIFRACQIGLQRAKGRYVCFLSANDLFFPEFLESCATALNKNRDAGLVFSASKIYDTQTNSYKEVGSPLEPGHYSADEYISKVRKAYFHIPSNTSMFRMSAIRSVAWENGGMGIFTDWYLIQAAAMTSGVVYVDRVLSKTISHPNSFSQSPSHTFRKLIGYLNCVINEIYKDKVLSSAVNKANILPSYSAAAIAYVVLTNPNLRFRQAWAWYALKLAIWKIGVERFFSPKTKNKLKTIFQRIG